MQYCNPSRMLWIHSEASASFKNTMYLMCCAQQLAAAANFRLRADEVLVQASTPSLCRCKTVGCALARPEQWALATSAAVLTGH